MMVANHVSLVFRCTAVLDNGDGNGRYICISRRYLQVLCWQSHSVKENNARKCRLHVQLHPSIICPKCLSTSPTVHLNPQIPFRLCWWPSQITADDRRGDFILAFSWQVLSFGQQDEPRSSKASGSQCLAVRFTGFGLFQTVSRGFFMVSTRILINTSVIMRHPSKKDKDRQIYYMGAAFTIWQWHEPPYILEEIDKKIKLSICWLVAWLIH